MTLRISDIRTDGGTQARARIDDATVCEYAEAITEGAKFPPITVFYDGSKYWLADGFHRLTAMKQIDCLEIEAEVKQGTQDAAIDFACSSTPNGRHGLREKPEDRRRRVDTMLRRKVGWSNRQIAEWCGVDEKTVRTVKAAGMAEVDRFIIKPTAENPQSSLVRGRDGRKINTTNIGHKSDEPKADTAYLEEWESRAEEEELEACIAFAESDAMTALLDIIRRPEYMRMGRIQLSYEVQKCLTPEEVSRPGMASRYCKGVDGWDNESILNQVKEALADGVISRAIENGDVLEVDGLIHPRPEAEEEAPEYTSYTSTSRALLKTADYIDRIMDELDPTTRGDYTTELLKHVRALDIQATRGEI